MLSTQGVQFTLHAPDPPFEKVMVVRQVIWASYTENTLCATRLLVVWPAFRDTGTGWTNPVVN